MLVGIHGIASFESIGFLTAPNSRCWRGHSPLIRLQDADEGWIGTIFNALRLAQFNVNRIWYRFWVRELDRN